MTLEGKTLSSKSTIPVGDFGTWKQVVKSWICLWQKSITMNGNSFLTLQGNSSLNCSSTKQRQLSAVAKRRFTMLGPLDPAVDNNLAAERLIEKLTRRFAIKKEWVAEIESLSGLKAGIRDAALRKVQEMPDSADRIAVPLGAIVGYRDRSMPEYQRALAWAEELQRIEPNSHRSRSLIGAAYYRVNRLEDA